MKQPAPISMSVAKKPPKKEVIPPTKLVEPFNMDAPEHREPTGRIITKVVKDTALEQRVASLEAKEIVVRVEAPKRPRIAKVKIKYSAFGAPEELIPVYSE